MGCAHWLTAGELAHISLIGRERHQGLVNSAHVRADTHVCNGASGGWWEEAKAGVVVVIVDVKILTIKITPQRMNIQFPLD